MKDSDITQDGGGFGSKEIDLRNVKYTECAIAQRGGCGKKQFYEDHDCVRENSVVIQD
jgi:hypothetical protein